jgi:Domain of unknown function (DUF4129)
MQALTHEGCARGVGTPDDAHRVEGNSVAAAAGTGAEALTPERLSAAHKALVADKSIQFDFPAQPVPPKPPEWLKPLFEFLEWLSPAFPYLFWGAVGLVVLLVLYFVLPNIAGFEWPWARGRKDGDDEAEIWRPEEGAARELLAEAEALAAAGRYAEAARLLLRRSVEDIGRRLPDFLRPSLTARDIAGADELPGNARPAFAAIARVVEVSAFGSRSVTEDAWRECREAYGRFALPASWSRTAAA